MHSPQCAQDSVEAEAVTEPPVGTYSRPAGMREERHDLAAGRRDYGGCSDGRDAFFEASVASEPFAGPAGFPMQA